MEIDRWALIRYSLVFTVTPVAACLILADAPRLIANVSHTHAQPVHRMHGDFSVISFKLTDVFSCVSMGTDLVLATVPASAACCNAINAALQLMLWMFTVLM